MVQLKASCEISRPTVKRVGAQLRGSYFSCVIYIYLETLSANIFAGGKILLNLRRKLVKTPEFCKNAGEFKKCWIYRCMLKQQKTEMISTYNYAGI
jgi:hypothetical protein